MGMWRGGLIFELWLHDSQFNFHQKIVMLFILICFCFFIIFHLWLRDPRVPRDSQFLIYIFFMFSSFFRFSICDYVIPVSPVTPSSWFICSLCFNLFYIFHLWLHDPRVPHDPQPKFQPTLDFGINLGIAVIFDFISKCKQSVKLALLGITFVVVVLPCLHFQEILFVAPFHLE